jgi:CheY-like chemotaxis protein
MLHTDDNFESPLWDTKIIMVIEDDSDIGAFFVEVLQAETSYHFLLESDAVQALTAVKAVIPDLFILDYMLPGINGLELFDKLQSIDEIKHVPVLLMSANAPEQEIKKRSLAFIKKPFEVPELLEKMEELLAS